MKLTDKEFETLQSCIDDHIDNIQYADEDEEKWRNECIEVLQKVQKILKER